jgi:hypothetical protein
MRKKANLLSLLLLLGLTVGCTTPPPITDPVLQHDAGKIAGQLAVLGFIALEKPAVSEQAVIKVTIEAIRTNVTAYQAGGFIAALPGVTAAIVQAFPGDQLKQELGKLLASDLLSAMDGIYAAHPSWDKTDVTVTNIVAGFLEGADSGFATFLKPCRLQTK